MSLTWQSGYRYLHLDAHITFTKVYTLLPLSTRVTFDRASLGCLMQGVFIFLKGGWLDNFSIDHYFLGLPNFENNNTLDARNINKTLTLDEENLGLGFQIAPEKRILSIDFH